MCTRIVIDSRALAIGITLLAQACGPAESKAPPKQPERAQITDVERFLPFEPNTVSAFETLSETGEKGVFMMQISRPRPDAVELDIGGKVQRLTIVADGAQLTEGGWLLKTPLTEGARFKGQFGDVLISNINRAIEVPAGKFDGCIETIEENQVMQRRVTTVFCPKVGIVSLEAEGKLGKDYGHQKAILRSHGPKVDINSL